MGTFQHVRMALPFLSKYSKRSAAVIVVLFSLVFHPIQSPAQRGALTIHRNLAQLSEQAGTIIHGVVVSARVEPHPEFQNLSTVVVTMRVNETLKGQAGQNYTFRQYIWDIRDRYDAAGYKKGEELLLLMNPVNKYGLTSPAGLEQGRFRITRDAAGKAQAVNGRANAGLLQNMNTALARKGARVSPHLEKLSAAHVQGEIALDDLKQLIQPFATKNKK